eukprot:TRINITY_DN58272_c0_g1_i1.p1 TRINITY_DN58272_c0_g1~~TRINITY_DN58272_c0_g1_i1.p1  ORF type:complete len:231 (+),score=28.64 TRINITY_DN58272_c0_g1_i1:123-815(+)
MRVSTFLRRCSPHSLAGLPSVRAVGGPRPLFCSSSPRLADYGGPSEPSGSPSGRGSVIDFLRRGAAASGPMADPEVQRRLKAVGERINVAVKDPQYEIVVFMKGHPGGMCCRFSDVVVRIFDHEYFRPLQLKVHWVDVTRDDLLREGVKVATGWPTIPQIFVRGEFVGGCDLMIEMANNGELGDLLVDLVNHRTDAPAEADGKGATPAADAGEARTKFIPFPIAALAEAQ